MYSYCSSHYLTIFKDVALQNLTRTQFLKPWRKAFNPAIVFRSSLHDLSYYFIVNRKSHQIGDVLYARVLN